LGFQVQVVSISSLKGGVGKTSVTTGLASAALSAGIPTLVVDLDPHADATTALGVQPAEQLDIGRMLKNPRKARLDENVAASGWIGQIPENPAAAGAPSPARNGHAVLDVAVGSAFTGIYDRPDLGRRDLRRLSAVLAGAGSYELVLVAEPGLFSVAGTERTMRAIQLFRKEFAPQLAPAGIVANRVRSGSSEHGFRLAEMESMFGELLLTPHIPEQANWQQIQGAAHAVHHWPGDSAKVTAKLFDTLLHNLIGSNGSALNGLRDRRR
jgi:cellulose biosynthesis protein BcsQ